MTDKQKFPGDNAKWLFGVLPFSASVIRDFVVADSCSGALCLWLKSLNAETIHIFFFCVFSLVLLVSYLRNR